MEITSLIIINPIIFLVLGFIFGLFYVKWRMRFYYVGSIIIFTIIAYFILMYEFNNSTGAYIYIPIYVAIGLLGSLFLQGTVRLIRSIINNKEQQITD